MHPLTALEFTTRVAKRAQYEAFEFTIDGGTIRIRNESHADPENHEYWVEITDELPVSCSCPYDARTERACKHRVAVAIRRPILDAVTARNSNGASTDGGTDTAAGQPRKDLEKIPTEEFVSEDCADCVETFPCWECYRTANTE